MQNIICYIFSGCLHLSRFLTFLEAKKYKQIFVFEYLSKLEIHIALLEPSPIHKYAFSPFCRSHSALLKPSSRLAQSRYTWWRPSYERTSEPTVGAQKRGAESYQFYYVQYSHISWFSLGRPPPVGSLLNSITANYFTVWGIVWSKVWNFFFALHCIWKYYCKFVDVWGIENFVKR